MTGTVPLTIREATSADAPRLSAFAAQLFRRTYASSAAPEDLEAYVTAHLHPDAQRAEIAQSGVRTLLAERGNALVGYAQLVAGSSPPASRSTGDFGAAAVEIKRFYVAPEWHGRGIAQDLMRACVRTVPTGTPIWLGVFASNARAIAFYTKCGFRIVGETTFVMGQDPQRDYVMRFQPGSDGAATDVTEIRSPSPSR